MTEYTHHSLAIIPARAGSKRLPGKNTRLLAGKPLIQWSIEAAQQTSEVNLVVVTSDDPLVLEIARSFDCITIERPDSLAHDTTSTFDVLQHALRWLGKQSIHPESTLLLQPTSPLRKMEDIQQGYQLMREKNASSIISVCPAEHSPLWCNQLDDSLCMDNFLPQNLLNTRSQDLPPYYRLNGAFYLAKTPLLLEHKGFFMPNSHALIMPQERSVDIDTAFDFSICELKIKQIADHATPPQKPERQ